MRFKLIILALLVLVNSGFSQQIYEFLRIDNSARAGALGGSFVSNFDDPNVIFYNPAGLNMITENPISFSYTGYLSSIKLYSLAYSSEIPELFRYGAAIKYISYGSMTEADEFGNQLGDFSANDLAIVLSGGSKLDENFYYGIGVEFIYSKIATYSSTGLAANLGLSYYIPSEELNIAISAMNLGTQLSTYAGTKENLPVDISIGASKKMAHIPIRFSLEFHNLSREADNFGEKLSNFVIGTEINLSKALTLRLGYDNQKRKDLKIGSYSGISGFNGGLGLNISNYTFDYGFSSFGLVGTVHRISIGTRL